MCLPIDSCFGFGTPRTDDDHYHAPAASRTQQHGQRNGGHYNGYPAHRAAAAEADRKASNDARRDHAHVVPAGAPRGWHGHGHGPATGAPQEKMAAYPPYAGADDGTLMKQQQPAAAAPNGRVAAADGQGARGGGAQHNYYYHYEPAHREDAADSYYPAATATADHERY